MAGRSDLPTQAEPGGASGLFAAGMRAIAEARSLEAFDQGAALIEQSAGEGHVDAICMRATMAAVGAGRARDWSEALDLLARAAELGSEHAQGQLRLLATTSGGAAVGEDWQQIGRGADPEKLLRAPPPEPVSERPRLRLFRGFAQPAECAWLISRLGPKLHPAAVWDELSGEGVVDSYRSNSAAELPLQDMDVVIAVLRARIASATMLPEFIFEIPQLMHYKVGEEFKPHHDYLDPSKPGHAADYARRGQRMGTFLIFLNDDFQGGETEFPKADISIRGRAGDALFFANVTRDGQPDPLTLHAGRSPTSGEKWILSQWIRERPPVEMVAAPTP